MGQKPLRKDGLYNQENNGTNTDDQSLYLRMCYIPFASGSWTKNGNIHLQWSLQVYKKYSWSLKYQYIFKYF